MYTTPPILRRVELLQRQNGRKEEENLITKVNDMAGVILLLSITPLPLRA